MTMKEGNVERASVLMCAAVGECIRDAGPLPSGHLYARLMGKMTLERYQQIIAVLKNAEMVKEEHHELTWIGPEKETGSIPSPEPSPSPLTIEEVRRMSTGDMQEAIKLGEMALPNIKEEHLKDLSDRIGMMEAEHKRRMDIVRYLSEFIGISAWRGGY